MSLPPLELIVIIVQGVRTCLNEQAARKVKYDFRRKSVIITIYFNLKCAYWVVKRS